MIIHPPLTFEDSLRNSNHFIWLDETLAEKSPDSEHLAVKVPMLQNQKEFSIFIGPEGGFSPTERSRLLQLTGSQNHEITRVHLGSIILRAETAALMSLSLLVGIHYGKRKN